MAGIPPLAGFFGKLYVFLGAVHAGMITLAVIGVLTSVVGAYYYLRIVKVMYFDEPAEAFDPAPYGAGQRRGRYLRRPAAVLHRADRRLAAASTRPWRPQPPWHQVTGAPFGHGFRLLELGAVGSTNDVARDLADQGESEGLFVQALEQTAGRGRHGRTWQSPPGNLHASLLLRPMRPMAEVASLSLAGRPGAGRGRGRAVAAAPSSHS